MGRCRARMEAVERVAPQVLHVDLAMVEPAALSYRAGQYVIVLINGAKRAYTLTSPGGARDRLGLLVKLLPGGPGSELFDHLQAGGEITFMGPHGFFLLQPSHPGDVVLVATGIGIAPYLSMLEEILGRADEGGRLILLWGVRSASDAYRLRRLEELQATHGRLTVELVDAAGGTWDEVEARLSGRVVQELFPGLDRPLFYLSGNGTLVRHLTQALTALGVDRKKQIASEIFYPQTEP